MGPVVGTDGDHTAYFYRWSSIIFAAAAAVGQDLLACAMAVSSSGGGRAAGGDPWGHHSKCWVCWGSTWICSTWFLLCSLAITNSDGSRACWGFHQDTVACTAALSGSSLRCLAGLLACAALLSEEQQHLGGGAWANFGKCWACWGGPPVIQK